MFFILRAELGPFGFPTQITLEILIKITREHTVIKLSHLIRTQSVELLKGGVRGYNIHLPG